MASLENMPSAAITHNELFITYFANNWENKAKFIISNKLNKTNFLLFHIR